MGLAKTRAQWAFLGILLLGPFVPWDFKRQSDGGSVPFGRLGKWAFNEKQWRAAAYIHDYWYWLIALMYASPKDKDSDPAGWSLWVACRLRADFELKQNRRMCARNRIVGWLASRVIFRGVRLGGRASVRKPENLWMPPTLEALGEIIECPELVMTEQAEAQIVKWRERIVTQGGSV